MAERCPMDIFLDGMELMLGTQLNGQVYIQSMRVFHDSIYAGTYSGGRLFRWNGTDAWIQVAPTKCGEAYVTSLCIFHDSLYGCASNHGYLFKWNGVDAWDSLAGKLNNHGLQCLCVYNDKIYGGVDDANGGQLFEWNGTNAWVEKAPQLNDQKYIVWMVVFHGKLYGGTYPGGRLFRWNDVDAWIQVAPILNGQTYCTSLCIFNDALYGAFYYDGPLFKYYVGFQGIDSIQPASGKQSSTVRFKGAEFGSTTGSVDFIMTTPLHPTTWNDSVITATIPANASRGYYRPRIYTSAGDSIFMADSFRVLVPTIIHPDW